MSTQSKNKLQTDAEFDRLYEKTTRDITTVINNIINKFCTKQKKA